MTDKIPSFKEEIDDIHVPIDKLDAIILKTVQGSKPKSKRSLRKKLVYSVGAAVVAFGLLVGSASVSPVMANIVSQIPFIGSIFSESDDRGLARVSKSGLTQIVGESKTVGGNTLTVDEVYYDGTRFNFGYSLESEEPLGKDYVKPRFTIDGEETGLSMGVGDGDESVITPTYRTSIIRINALEGDLPSTFDLGLTFEGEGGEKWEFSVPVKKQSNTKFVTVDHAQKLREIELSVSNLKFGPGGLLLTYQSSTKKYDRLRIMDFMDFRIVDSLGNELVLREGGASGNDFLMKGSYLFDPISSDATEVTITPYIEFPKQGEWGTTDWEGNDVDVDLTPYKGKELEFDSFTVKLP